MGKNGWEGKGGSELGGRGEVCRGERTGQSQAERREGEKGERERERGGEREEALTCQLAEVRETTHPWEIYTNTSLLLPVCGGEGG